MADPTMQEFANERVKIQVEINAAKADRDIVVRDLQDLQTNLAALMVDKNALSASLDELRESVSGEVSTASETLAGVRVIMKATAGLINEVKSEIPALLEQIETLETSLAATREAGKEAHDKIAAEYEGLHQARADLDIYRDRLKEEYAEAGKALIL